MGGAVLSQRSASTLALRLDALAEVAGGFKPHVPAEVLGELELHVSNLSVWANWYLSMVFDSPVRRECPRGVAAHENSGSSAGLDTCLRLLSLAQLPRPIHTEPIDEPSLSRKVRADAEFDRPSPRPRQAAGPATSRVCEPRGASCDQAGRQTC